jgi:hypothetical protein
MSTTLFVLFCAKSLDTTPEKVPLTKGPATEGIDLLGMMQRPLKGAHDILALPYDASGEDEFDEMLEELEVNPVGKFGVRSSAAASVWAERVKQAVLTLTANMIAGEQVLVPPREMPKHLREVAYAILMLHRMELPFHPGTATPRP